MNEGQPNTTEEQSVLEQIAIIAALEHRCGEAENALATAEREHGIVPGEGRPEVDKATFEMLQALGLETETLQTAIRLEKLKLQRIAANDNLPRTAIAANDNQA